MCVCVREREVADVERGSGHVSHNVWACAPHSKMTETAAAYLFFEYLYF